MLHRRRQVSLWALAVLVAVSACGNDDGPSSRPSASSQPSETTEVPTPEPTTSQPTTKPVSCVDRTLHKLNLAERVGQLFMGGVDVSRDPAVVPAALGESQVGSIILFGNSTGGQEVAAAAIDRGRTVVGTPGGVAPIVAADQEGGQVQRLQGPGFSTIPSAEDQAALPAAELRSDAETWGSELRDAGVNLDLAPVADVVPDDIGDANEPIGALDRGYGSSADDVSTHVAAFVEGMADAGVATSVKHFPGLGKVEGNTDFSADVHDQLTSRDDPDLATFKAGVAAGAQLVMIASAIYDKIDSENHAVFSSTVIDGMVRGDLGFDGVVISDDMGAAAAVKDVPAGERALRFLRAGGDIVLTIDASEVLPAMTQAVRAEATADAAFNKQLTQSVRRVLSMKDEMGLLGCSG